MLAAAAGYWMGRETTASAAADHVFEIRRMTAEPGKLADLHARFRDHTDAIFRKHNVNTIAYFAPMDEPLSKNTLIYILEYPNREAAKKLAEELRADMEWKKAVEESEVYGKIVTGVESIFVTATEYSKLK